MLALLLGPDRPIVHPPDGRQGWHFPPSATDWSGPAGSANGIEKARRLGAPATTFGPLPGPRDVDTAGLQPLSRIDHSAQSRCRRTGGQLILIACSGQVAAAARAAAS